MRTGGSVRSSRTTVIAVEQPGVARLDLHACSEAQQTQEGGSKRRRGVPLPERPALHLKLNYRIRFPHEFPALNAKSCHLFV